MTIANIGRKRVNGKNYSIRVSKHFLKRIKERNLEIRDIMSIFNSIDFFTLSNLAKEVGSEVAIIDYERSVTVFFGVKVNKFNFITALNGTDNYIEEDTKIIEINLDKK